MELKNHFPTPRHAVDYIMDTFPIVKRKDEKQHGEYRTKRRILEIYYEMAEVMKANDEPETDHSPLATYRSPLNPPPGLPVDEQGTYVPMAQWNPNNWPEHIHPPRAT